MENLRKRTMAGGGLSGQVASGSEAVALDVLFSANDGSELVLIRGEENWPSGGWTPIGIVVVPGTHNRYSDGSCGVMSLNGLDSSMYFTGEGTKATDKRPFESTNLQFGFSEYTFDTERDMMFENEEGYSSFQVPYQMNDSTTNCAYYYGMAQWPYNGYNDGGIFYPNDGYATNITSYSGTYPYVSSCYNSLLCDFNGIRNTAAMYVASRYNHMWTDNSFNTVYDTDPAAAATAGRYKTVGTQSFLDVFEGTNYMLQSIGTPESVRYAHKPTTGFWYLPAVGELSYIPSKFFEIQKLITALNQKYRNCALQLSSTYGYYLSSNTILVNGDSNMVFYVNSRSGEIQTTDRINRGCGRAFLRF